MSWLKGWVTPGALRAAGVLGMNERNYGYILKENKRRNFKNVDDKLITKQLAHHFGVSSPGFIGLISCQYEIRKFEELVAGRNEFVIKPTRGSGGRGIVVIKGRSDSGGYIGSNGRVVPLSYIREHLSNILSGLYSLGGAPDKALIEECVEFTDAFDGFSYQGVPDVRIIVFRGYPVMAMMRLSTAASGGRANLHQGAVGVGISLSSGRARRAVMNGRIVEKHPDTGRDLCKELVVPRWREHLNIAAGGYEMTGLGYFGADIVLDRKRGPMLLELNARPGLAIQIANGEGLGRRLERLKAGISGLELSPAERVDFSLKLFSSD